MTGSTDAGNASASCSQRLKAALRCLSGYRLGQLAAWAPRPHNRQFDKSIEYRSRFKFSLVTPVWNQAPFIGQTMASVLGQGLSPLEYIVVDGGSTDGTTDIIAEYLPSLAHFTSERDSGQADAINKGFARATGDILGWINGDDLLLPGALRYVAEFFEANPDIDVVYGNRIVIDGNGHEISRWELPGHSDRILSWVDYVPQETLFWRRSVWEKVGARLDTSYDFAMDWDLLVRFRDCGARFCHLPRFLGAFRTHPQQKTVLEIDAVGKAEMTRIRRRCLGYEPSSIEIHMAVAPYVLWHMARTWRTRLTSILESD